MEDVDIQQNDDYDEEDLFLRDVISGEHDLLFLDSYMRESLRASGTAGRMAHALEEEPTI